MITHKHYLFNYSRISLEEVSFSSCCSSSPFSSSFASFSSFTMCAFKNFWRLWWAWGKKKEKTYKLKSHSRSHFLKNERVWSVAWHSVTGNDKMLWPQYLGGSARFSGFPSLFHGFYFILSFCVLLDFDFFLLIRINYITWDEHWQEGAQEYMRRARERRHSCEFTAFLKTCVLITLQQPFYNLRFFLLLSHCSYQDKRHYVPSLHLTQSSVSS